MSIGRVSGALVLININQWCGKKLRSFLKVPGEDIYLSNNRVGEVFVMMGHGSFVGGGSNLGFLP